MTEENLTTTSAATEQPAAEPAAPVNDDAALEAVWNELERDNGAARGADGKFTKEGGAEADKAADPANPTLEGEGSGEEQQTAESSAAQAVPLPANWNGMDEDWSKIPPEVQAKIAARDVEIHTRMSEQGRQISAFKPYTEVFERNKDLLAGKKLADGTEPTTLNAVDFLFNAQRRLDQNPIAGLIEIADRYGVREHLAAALTGRIQVPPDPQPAGVSPADVERIVKDALNESATSRAVEDEISRLSKGKPLYSEIGEDDMVHAIGKARAKLGEAASREAVFDLAYDIAINADPDLRVKAAALKKAAAVDPKKTADAKRAASVNVSSTQTGQSRKLTEDEELAAVFDELTQ